MTSLNTTDTVQSAQSSKASAVYAVMAAMVLGFATIFVVGHLQAATLHDAAHDVRHATGFPCH